MPKIYADYSGGIKDPNDNLVIYATVIIPERLADAIQKAHSVLIAEVATFGIRIHEKFEFHTVDIVSKNNEWRYATEKQVIFTLSRLKRFFTDFRLPVIVILVDKSEGGSSAIKDIRKQVNMNITQELENQIKVKLREEGFIGDFNRLRGDYLGSLIGMLFGLTNGYMHNNGLHEKAEVVVDKQFVNHIEYWKAVFMFARLSWFSLAKLGVFYTWPKDNLPEWYLSDSVEELESYSSVGVQLADFAAYTTRSVQSFKYQKHKSFSVIKKRNMNKIQNGLHVGIRN